MQSTGADQADCADLLWHLHSRGLVFSSEKLATSDRRNDGQAALGDALIPGSKLPALVNADHWDLAIALDEQMPFLSARASDRPFPRDLAERPVE